MKKRKGKKIWGYVHGNNYRARAFYAGEHGRDGEPWYTTKSGKHWSAYDVSFTPDKARRQRTEGK